MLGAKKNVFIKKKKFKHTKLIVVILSILVLGGALAYFYVPEVKTWVTEIKKWIVTLILGFVLVNGKFVLKAFAKKIFILSVIGLSKRFFVEKIFMENMMKLFIKKLPLKDFFKTSKEKVKETKLAVKATWIGGILFSTAGGLFAFGDVVLLKVILAKFWSFMLVLFSKFMLLVGYLLLDSGWVRMLIEVVIIGFLMEVLKKIPFVHKLVMALVKWFIKTFRFVGRFFENTFNMPAQKGINKLTIATSKWMHKSMGSEGFETYHEFIIREREEKLPVYKQLEEYRDEIKPSSYKQLQKKRRTYKRPGTHLSAFEMLKKQQKTDFDVSVNRLYLHKEHKL